MKQEKKEEVRTEKGKRKKPKPLSLSTPWLLLLELRC
jgi:hypothetical protein